MSEVLAQRDEAATQRREAERERATLAEKSAQLEKERARVGTSYREELERLRDDVTRQLSAEIKHLRDLDRSAREKINPNEVLKTVTKPVERAIEFVPAESTRPVRVGEKVEHRKFKVKGDVVSIDGQKAVLNANGKKMTVELRDLVAIGGTAPAPTKRPQVSTSESGEIGAELNLVGQRVDDAIEASDRFLDRALLEGKSAVRIIHGFGTGALRKALREYLRKHPAVKSWRPGGDNEGGDGATVAVLE
jgi:DNA mismatch repair protein MutS2